MRLINLYRRNPQTDLKQDLLFGGGELFVPIYRNIEQAAKEREVKAEAERTDFPQSGQKRPCGNAEHKGLHTRMAWLLRNCKHEKYDGRLGQVAAPPFPDVHLETVEEAKDACYEPKEVRHAGLAGLPKREYTQRLLGCYWKWHSHAHDNEQRLAQAGYYSILDRYESLHLCG